MPKLYFRYGVMNSAKTANLLMMAHNYRSQGKKIILMKPSIDTRFGEHTIKSRAVQEMTADIIILPCCRIFDIPEDTACVLVDEAQFLSPVNVEGLRELSETVPIVCYGLRTDYRSFLFPGSKRLLEIADTIEEVKTICVNCEKKAIINAKFFYSTGVCENGNSEDMCNDRVKIILKSGSDKPDLGSENKYQSMCFSCWNTS